MKITGKSGKKSDKYMKKVLRKEWKGIGQKENTRNFRWMFDSGELCNGMHSTSRFELYQNELLYATSMCLSLFQWFMPEMQRFYHTTF